jgi:pimeloyl-ACP methyl ester carboxylesterase
MTETGPENRKISLASGLNADVLVKGRGTPLLFLHPAQGRVWSPFLDGLTHTHTVYVPLTPGADDPDELMSFDAFSDLALFYDDLLRALSLEDAVVVGHAFGGMAAAEFAAHCPDRVSALILIAAMGLWFDETPVADVHTTHPTELAGLLFTDPDSEAARSVLQKPTPQDRLTYQLAMGASCHFYWPVPDRDLKRRLYRISAPTLLIWGDADRVVPPAYADGFARGIRRAKKMLVHGAGHFPHLEKSAEVIRSITSFLTESVPEFTAAR